MLKSVPTHEKMKGMAPEETPKFDQKTLFAAAMLLSTNGYVQHGLAKDTRKTQHERAARTLCSNMCEGIAKTVLALNGATAEQVEILMCESMDQILAREKIVLP